MGPTTCPTQAELSAFALGRLSRSALGRIALHVEGCPACETTLQGLDAGADSVLARLRQPAGAFGSTAELVPLPLLAAARAAADSLEAGCRTGAGQRLGKFELLEELGVGSFGTVF